MTSSDCYASHSTQNTMADTPSCAQDWIVSFTECYLRHIFVTMLRSSFMVRST